MSVLVDDSPILTHSMSDNEKHIKDMPQEGEHSFEISVEPTHNETVNATVSSHIVQPAESESIQPEIEEAQKEKTTTSGNTEAPLSLMATSRVPSTLTTIEERRDSTSDSHQRPSISQSSPHTSPTLLPTAPIPSITSSTADTSEPSRSRAATVEHPLATSNSDEDFTMISRPKSSSLSVVRSVKVDDSPPAIAIAPTSMRQVSILSELTARGQSDGGEERTAELFGSVDSPLLLPTKAPANDERLGKSALPPAPTIVVSSVESDESSLPPTEPNSPTQGLGTLTSVESKPSSDFKRTTTLPKTLSPDPLLTLPPLMVLKPLHEPSALIAPPPSLHAVGSFESTGSNGSNDSAGDRFARGNPSPAPASYGNGGTNGSGPSALGPIHAVPAQFGNPSSRSPTSPTHSSSPTQPQGQGQSASAPVSRGYSFTFWIGCWNMGAKEMSPIIPVATPVALNRGGSMRGSLAVPASSNAPVQNRPGPSVSVGSNATSSGSVLGPTPNATPASPSSSTSGSSTTSSSSSSPFASWIPTGYKMYVIGLQESVSESTFKSLDAFFLGKGFDCQRMQIPVTNTHGEVLAGTLGGTVKIEGRGDGSFIYPKATSIAIWIHRSARNYVEYCAHGALSLGLTQGSKGGAAIAIKILDATLVFVSCHLSSTTLAARRLSYTSLVESVGNALGERYFQLLEQFHHTFFLGDLNFRLREGVTAPEAVKYMQRRDVRGLFAFDELNAEMFAGGSFGSFQEAPIDFFPTYKKHEGRKIPTMSKENIYWVHDVYKTIYKQPWYKTGNTAQRVPSWCDRIIRHSLPDQADRIRVLQFHPDEPVTEDTSASSSSSKNTIARIGGTGGICTYRALEDGLTGSDHSAVSCGFVLALPRQVDWSLRGSIVGGMGQGHQNHLVAPVSSSARNVLLAPNNIPTRSASSSVSAISSLPGKSAPPSVYVVRFHSVRVLQSPRLDVPSPMLHQSVPSVSVLNAPLGGLEPKYVRVLFPAPFETGAHTPFASKQVAFGPAASSQNGSGTPPHLEPAEQVPGVKAEFRCLAFEDPIPNGVDGGASSMEAAEMPGWAPYHFLIKIHSADDISGQCVIPLFKSSFEQKHVLEFHERLTRDGLPLMHPYTKQHVQVHFILTLDVARPGAGVSNGPAAPHVPLTKAGSAQHVTQQ